MGKSDKKPSYSTPRNHKHSSGGSHHGRHTPHHHNTYDQRPPNDQETLTYEDSNHIPHHEHQVDDFYSQEPSNLGHDYGYPPQDQRRPRGKDDELVPGLEDLNISGTDEERNPIPLENDTPYEDAVYQTGYDDGSTRLDYTDPSYIHGHTEVAEAPISGQHSRSRKGKEKERRTTHRHSTQDERGSSTVFENPQTIDPYGVTDHTYTGTRHLAPVPEGSIDNDDRDEDDGPTMAYDTPFDDDPQMQEIINENRRVNNTHKTGGPSSSTIPAYSTISPSYEDEVQHENIDQQFDPESYIPELIDPTYASLQEQGPGSSKRKTKHKKTNSRVPEQDNFGRLFKVEHSNRYQPGEVFKLVWYEPKGKSLGERFTEFADHEHYSGIRRFIVVAQDRGHCTCVPILTYERQGCTKRGVKQEVHGVIYDAKNGLPPILQGEDKLGFDPVPVTIDNQFETLDETSRVNYAKLTSIEHNFPVIFIGSITPADFEHVRYAVDYCWSRKLKDSSKKKKR